MAINDAVEILDQYYIDANNSVDDAIEMLPPDALAFIEEETSRCLDVRYYLENYHCITDEQGGFRSLYPWWDHQEILYEAMQEEWAEHGRCKVIVLKPRQTGISVWTAATMFHRTITTPHTFTMIVAQNPGTATYLQNLCLKAYDALPWWLKPEYLYKTKGNAIEFQRQNEKERLVNPGLGSSIHVAYAGRATGVAIGRSIRNLHGSECSRWPESDVYQSDIKPSLNARDTYAVLESTGYGRQGFFYDWWQGSMEEETGYRPVFIPVYKVKKYYLPLSERAAKTFKLTDDEKAFTTRILKEEKFAIPDSFWNLRRMEIRAAKRGSGKAGYLESFPINPAEAFQGSGLCAFDAESIERQQMRYICKPIFAGEIMLDEDNVTPNPIIREVGDDEILSKRKGERPSDRLWVWVLPEKGSTYYVAMDTALGVKDGDYSVAQVFRAGAGQEKDEQVAEWWGHIPPQQFARLGAALGYWYNGAEIACEYQGPGITAGDKLKDLDYPALYRPQHKDRNSVSFTVYIHWMTNSKTRDQIIASMNEAMLEDTVILHSEDLIDEAIDFASTGGRFEGQGNHDDGIMTALIALYCLRETTTHIKASPGRTQEHSSGDINVYGVFDHLMRQRGQYSTKAEAEFLVVGKSNWSVRPILICKANTMTSLIDTPGTAEYELRYKHGMERRGILPDVVNAYRDAVGFNGYGRRGVMDSTSDPDW